MPIKKDIGITSKAVLGDNGNPNIVDTIDTGKDSGHTMGDMNKAGFENANPPTQRIQKHRIYLSVRTESDGEEVAKITYLSECESAEECIEYINKTDMLYNSRYWRDLVPVLRKLYECSELLFVWMKEPVS